MTFLAWAFMIISAAQAIFSTGAMVEAVRRGGKHECSFDLGTVMAFIFAGRILGWW